VIVARSAKINASRNISTFGATSNSRNSLNHILSGQTFEAKFLHCVSRLGRWICGLQLVCVRCSCHSALLCCLSPILRSEALEYVLVCLSISHLEPPDSHVGLRAKCRSTTSKTSSLGILRAVRFSKTIALDRTSTGISLSRSIVSPLLSGRRCAQNFQGKCYFAFREGRTDNKTFASRLKSHTFTFRATIAWLFAAR